jgi:hypothetical protein
MKYLWALLILNQNNSRPQDTKVIKSERFQKCPPELA